MEFMNLENEQALSLASTLTVVICSILFVAFIIALWGPKKWKPAEFISYTPALLRLHVLYQRQMTGAL